MIIFILASLQVKNREELKESLYLIKQGLAELPQKSDIWEGYFLTLNNLIRSKVEECLPNSFTLDLDSLAGKYIE